MEDNISFLKKWRSTILLVILLLAVLGNMDNISWFFYRMKTGVSDPGVEMADKDVYADAKNEIQQHVNEPIYPTNIRVFKVTKNTYKCTFDIYVFNENGHKETKPCTVELYYKDKREMPKVGSYSIGIN